MESAHNFRLLHKKYLSSKNVSQKPTNGTIFIAKTFPPWQCCVLNTMKEMHDVSLIIYNFRLDEFFGGCHYILRA